MKWYNILNGGKGGEIMARRRGLKKWDRVTVEGWLRLMGDTSVMSHLMMEIFGRLYDSTDHMDNGKSIASALHMEYRALNSAVGWAGTKIREMVEKGLVPVYPEKEKKTLAAPSLVQESLGEASLEEKASETSETMAPWEYVFDGAEGDNGVYFWILKPEAASAYREIREAGSREIASISKILEDDETADGVEESLFPFLPTIRCGPSGGCWKRSAISSGSPSALPIPAAWYAGQTGFLF